MARELTPAELRELLGAVRARRGRRRRARPDRAVPRAHAGCPGRGRPAPRDRGDPGVLGPRVAPEDLWSRIEDALGAEPPGLVLPLERRRPPASPTRAARHRGTRRRRDRGGDCGRGGRHRGPGVRRDVATGRAHRPGRGERRGRGDATGGRGRGRGSPSPDAHPRRPEAAEQRHGRGDARAARVPDGDGHPPVSSTAARTSSGP